MSVLVVSGYRDKEFKEYEDLFYENFNPDDWDYLIIGEDQNEVQNLAWRLEVCDSELKQVGSVWVAVTYHS